MSDASPSISRRHDLDALRAFAMLLGILLHGALSFLPVGWPVQDSQSGGFLGPLVAAIHGFRMPVFFVMSGFFTAMLWRRRGLGALLRHRFQRIAVPLLLGLVTVVPAVEQVSSFAIKTAVASRVPAPSPVSPGDQDGAALDEPAAENGLTRLTTSVIRDDLETTRALLKAGASPEAPNRDGSSPLLVAALQGRTDAAVLLIEAGANLDRRGADGSTALHTAAFFGHADVAEKLLEAGADPSLENGYGQTPLQALGADWQTTAFIAGLVGVELEQAKVEAGRAAITELLGVVGEASVGRQEAGSNSQLLKLFHEPFFHHLWFLAFLCWLVVAFALYALVSDRFGWQGLPAGLVISPWRVLWLIPITALPQLSMGRTAPVFGADTSAGLLPMPHVLAYYAIFFFFGALYFDADDQEGRVGRRWSLALLLAVLLFPGGLILAHTGRHQLEPPILALSATLQVSYTWAMTFGLIGLFRRCLRRENPQVRYLSDASYWLYLTHLPLIIGAQFLTRDLPFPAFAKLAVICLGVTGVLLLVYQAAVRSTWIGRLLNGPRRRPSR